MFDFTNKRIFQRVKYKKYYNDTKYCVNLN